ncbi:unnamed protein product [Cuscuta epithymum]|uniref:Histone acetyltransferase n=1 Tax=Cuscuta epithymum TaxID=186058 RepID=A0AAV0CY92_9ASTE|nr:unnamed protein product [Cuscuta epithymum]
MPRPGPRPYECVRRAWHSDRHNPMRGSLIQEIFRIANESHRPETKKNKEWQEKLPIVVLKAEEIMYFKANSEAEYVDLKTLWERVNDAIDTIIRRDESTETGELLQPCIEAALHLGCKPRRATRSQRNNSGMCYLSSRDSDAPSSSPITLRDQIHGNSNPCRPFVPPNFSFISPNTSSFHAFETDSSMRFPFLPENYVNRRLPSSPDSHSVYPLYFGSEFQSNCPKYDRECVWNNISAQNMDACNSPSNNNSIACCSNVPFNQPGPECDLSLRLGPAAPPPRSDRLASSQSRDKGVEEVLKWQKVGISHLYEERPFYPPMNLQLNSFVGNMSNAGP